MFCQYKIKSKILNGGVSLIGLKAQKHQAQGNALGKDYIKEVALKGQKQLVINAFALSGRLL